MSSGTRGTATSCFHTIGARWRSSGFLVRMATPINIPRKVKSSRSESLEVAGFNRNLCIYDQTSINSVSPVSSYQSLFINNHYIIGFTSFAAFLYDIRVSRSLTILKENDSTVSVYTENHALQFRFNNG